MKIEPAAMIRLNLSHTELRPDGLRFDPESGVLLAPTSRLVLDPNRNVQPRELFAPDRLKALRADIDDWRDEGNGLCGTGIMEPLKVRWPVGVVSESARKKAEIRIWDGERRWRVTHDDYPWLPVTFDDLTDKEARRAALRTSLQKEDLTPVEWGHAFKEEMEAEGWNFHQCGRFYKVGESYVRNRVNLVDNCSRAAQKMASDHPDTMSHALLLGAWRERITADDEKELIAQIKEGMSVPTLRAELEARAENLKMAQEARTAPDRETASRASTFERTGGHGMAGSVSRGREVKSHSVAESRQEAQLSLERASKNLETAAGWMENLSDKDRAAMSAKYGVVLRRKLKELFPELK